jgi:hypothetical protein
MAKTISEINKKLNQFDEKYKESGLTDGKISHKAAMANLKGSDSLKMSDEAKKKISEASKGKPKSKIHIESLKKTKLKFKITKEDILKAENDVLLEKGVITAKEVSKKLNIDFHTFKGIAEYHGVYKSQKLPDRNMQNCSVSVLAYHCKTMKFIKEFTSIADAARELGVGGSNIVNVCKGKYKQCNGYYFEYKNK